MTSGRQTAQPFKPQFGLILFAVAIVLLSGGISSTQAQWSSSTGVVYTTNTSDKVGIGRSNPFSALHVSGGDISVDADQGIRKTGDNWIIGYLSSLPGIAIGSGTASDQVSIKAGASERLRILTNGNVGIGTTTPGSKLDVYGDVRARDVVGTGIQPLFYGYLDGAGRMIANLYSRDQVGVLDLSLGDGNIGTKINGYGYSYFSGGNVGIGTTSPTIGHLQVQGPATGQQIYSVSTATAGGSSNYGLDAEAVGTGPLLNVGGFFNAQGATNNRGVQISAISSSANNYAIYADAAAQSYFGGNVGIGTASPPEKLSISAGALHMTNMGTIPTANTNEIKLFSYDVFGSGSTLVGRADDYLFTTPSGGVNLLALRNSGNVGIGTANPLQKLQIGDNSTASLGLRIAATGVNWDQTTDATGNLNIANGNGSYLTFNKASISSSFTGNVTVSGTLNAKYQDVAEWVPSSRQLAPGTVVVLDSNKSNQVTSSSVSYDTRVAGVVSEQPGIALGEKSDGKVLVATTGRVRVKVDATKGPIHVGDLLVTSDISGVAMKSEPVNLGGVQLHRPGTLIGKALEPLEKGKGEILVLLSLQ